MILWASIITSPCPRVLASVRTNTGRTSRWLVLQVRKAVYRSQGYDFDWFVKRVAELPAMDVGDVLKRGRYPQTVKARSILLYWVHRELGIPTTELARRMSLSQPAVSHSVARGEKLVRENGYILSAHL